MLVFGLACVPVQGLADDLVASPVARPVPWETQRALAPLLPRVRLRFGLRQSTSVERSPSDLGLNVRVGLGPGTAQASVLLELIWTLPGGGALPSPRTLDTTWRTVR